MDTSVKKPQSQGIINRLELSNTYTPNIKIKNDDFDSRGINLTTISVMKKVFNTIFPESVGKL